MDTSSAQPGRIFKWWSLFIRYWNLSSDLQTLVLNEISIFYLKPALLVFAHKVAEGTDLTKLIKTRVLSWHTSVTTFLPLWWLKSDMVVWLHQQDVHITVLIIVMSLNMIIPHTHIFLYDIPYQNRTEGWRGWNCFNCFKHLLAAFSKPVWPLLLCLYDLKLNNYLDNPLAWWKMHKINFPQLCK